MSETAVMNPTAVPFLDAAASADADSMPDALRQAKQISDEIDASIALDKAERKARKDAGDISLLLLGQSESGKSTLLKQFQLLNSQHAFDDERASWKPVILLNILNTVRNILSVIKDDPSVQGKGSLEPGLLTRMEQTLPELLSCEDRLIQILVSSGHIQAAASAEASSSKTVYMRRKAKNGVRTSVDNTRKILSTEDSTAWESIASMVGSYKDDISRLWQQPLVKHIVKERLQEDWRAYFIEHIARVTALSYQPTDDDILHVRIMTMGVVEHTFKVAAPSSVITFKKTPPKELNMVIYDVGGARGQRHTWAPYFDDVTAIIFLAPISTFDQYLNEDHTVNRIQDSIELFQKTCENPILAKVEIVLFLNKCDLLEQKLDAGIQVKDFIPSYGDEPNNIKAAKKYFGAHFQAVFQRSQKKIPGKELKRALFTHYTSVVDTESTRAILSNVQDGILRSQLKDAKLM